MQAESLLTDEVNSLKQDDIGTVITRRLWQRIGHILRRDPQQIARKLQEKDCTEPRRERGGEEDQENHGELWKVR